MRVVLTIKLGDQRLGKSSCCLSSNFYFFFLDRFSFKFSLTFSFFQYILWLLKFLSIGPTQMDMLPNEASVGPTSLATSRWYASLLTLQSARLEVLTCIYSLPNSWCPLGSCRSTWHKWKLCAFHVGFDRTSCYVQCMNVVQVYTYRVMKRSYPQRFIS